MRRLTETEKARIRELAAEKQTTRMIGADIGRAHRSVWGYLEALRRPAPRPRVRSPLRLSLAEREEISRGLAGDESLRVIAAGSGEPPPRCPERSPATVVDAVIGRVEPEMKG